MSKLGFKVSFIVTLMVAVIVGLTIWIVSVQTNSLVNDIASSNAQSANYSLQAMLEEYQDEVFSRAEMIGKTSGVISAVRNSEPYSLYSEITALRSGVDIIIVYDRNGKFLTRSDSGLDGSIFDNQEDIQETLSTWQGTRTIKKGTDGKLYTYGSSVIRGSDGAVIGAVVCAHDLTLEKHVDKIKERSNCDVSIFVGDIRMATTLIDENGERPVGLPASAEIAERVIGQGLDFEARAEFFGETLLSLYTPFIVDDEVIGMLYAGVNIDSAIAKERGLITSVLLAIAITGIVCIVIIFVFSSRAISRPLNRISHFAERIRQGDIGIASGSEISIDVHSNDEVGLMAHALESAFAELRGYVGEIGERMNELAKGDLVTESTYEFQGDFILIKDSINNIVRDLSDVMKKFKMSAAQVSTSSSQIAAGAKLLAEGATIQASSIDELSATINEILEETTQNAKVAKEATELSSSIRGYAEKGSLQMEKMMLAIDDINESSNKISKVIKVIDDIAFQTNILALNAAIEAARAGVHGKGFAVVADEVRDLATKSALAANDTANMIADSVEKANLGLDIANETYESLKEIVDGINRSAEIVIQVAESSEEQASIISQVNTGIDLVAQVVSQNNATAEESAAASVEMSEQSLVLQQTMQHFKVDDKFD